MSVDYNCLDHRSGAVGYPNPDNSINMAKFVFKRLCQKKITDFYLVGVDNSSTMLASCLIMECHKSKKRNKPKPIFISGNKNGATFRPSRSGFYPYELPTVYLDDYYSLGSALSYTREQIESFVPSGAKALLYVFLISTGRPKEVIEKKHTTEALTCQAEILLEGEM